METLLSQHNLQVASISLNFATVIAALTGFIGFVLGRWSSRRLKPGPVAPARIRRTETNFGDHGELDSPDCVRIRFIHINDVYTLENLPRFCMLLEEYSNQDMIPPRNLVVSIGGDLLSPYPLSALDQGKGMVDVLLRCGVKYAIFGNHEADVGLKALKARVQQWQRGGGVWLNSNMPDLLPELDLPRRAHVIGYSKNLQMSRHVELMGVCSTDPGLYVPTANFGGAIHTASDCNETVLRDAVKLKSGEAVENGQVDAVIAFTHQDTEPDRVLARKGRDAGVHLVLGGHDHDEYLEEHNGCVMAKAGSDAHKAVVVDLVWRTPEDVEPEIVPRLLPVGDTASKAVSKAADGHMAKVRAFDQLKGQMELMKFPEETLVSSRGIRERQTEMGSLLCTALREELGVDCVLFDAGNIRGDRDYKPIFGHHLGPQWAFTMADLEAEVPYPSPMVEIMMRGSDVAEAVRWSRSRNEAFGGFLQTDRGIGVASWNQAQVTHIENSLFDESRWLRVGLMYNSLVGMNGNPVFKRWRETPDNIVPPVDVGRPAKVLLLRYFARMTWKGMPPFREMVQLEGCQEQKNPESIASLSLETIRQAYIQAYPNHENAAEAMAQRLLAVADSNGDGRVTKEEIETLFPLPRWMTLMILPSEPLISSKRVREEQTTMGYLICDALCKELGADCCLFDGGNIRGDQDYVPVPGHRRGKFWQFTLQDLRKELPWPSEMVVISMQGKDIDDAIRWARSPSRNRGSPSTGFGGFLQTDSFVHIKRLATGEVQATHVADKPLEPDLFYKVALMHNSLEGMNDNPTFAAWRNTESNVLPRPGMSSEHLVLCHYTRLLWATMPDFDSMDRSKSGDIGWRDLHQAVTLKFLEANRRQPGAETVKEIVRRLLYMTAGNPQIERISKEDYSKYTEEACSRKGSKISVHPPFFGDTYEGGSTPCQSR